jgi:hypothetical protein
MRLLSQEFLNQKNVIFMLTCKVLHVHKMNELYSIEQVWPCGRHRMVVGFTIGYAINAYHH